jgi:hypothetical protein
VILAAAIPVLGQPQPPGFPDLDAARRAAIVDSLTAALDTVYVFPDVARQMVDDVRGRLARGEYDDITAVPEFTDRLTEDFRAISHDLHLRVGVTPPPPPGEAEDPAVARRRAQERNRFNNYSFEKVERLNGNVGYLKLNGFSGDPEAGPTAVAAMNFLGHCDALIVDLTDNGGGSPSMIQLLTSYLVDGPTHLNSFYIRTTDTTKQFWTLPWVPGPRLFEIPIYVLTSRYTFSGAEEFTYNLKNLERATIVGETTGGGAHPVNGHFFDFGDYHVTMSLPFGRAVNPITGTNWEGTGIEPHLACPRDEAFDTAYVQALATLEESCDDPERKFGLAWAREGLAAKLAAVSLTSDEMHQYEGIYGPRRVHLENGTLLYQRQDNDPMVMIPMGDDTFRFEEIDWFRAHFERDEDGRVIRLKGLYRNGRTDITERDG